MSQEKKAQRALRSMASDRVYGRHSGFRNLKVYRLAELLYDFTCRFCERYIPFKDRHHDQMVQAARSGYMNLGEGSEDSATSKKLEMNLTNVARSSLGELHKDYVKHLNRRRLRQWSWGDREFEEARLLRPANLAAAVEWVNRGGVGKAEERAANLGVVLAAQAHWLAERLLDRQARDFEAGGGFSERLYAARAGRAGKNGQNGQNGGKR
jgi:four helix bundle suffix protein